MDETCPSFALKNKMKNSDFSSSVSTDQITDSKSIYRFKINLQIQNQFTESKSNYRFKINLQIQFNLQIQNQITDSKSIYSSKVVGGGLGQG